MLCRKMTLMFLNPSCEAPIGQLFLHLGKAPLVGTRHRDECVESEV